MRAGDDESSMNGSVAMGEVETMVEADSRVAVSSLSSTDVNDIMIISSLQSTMRDSLGSIGSYRRSSC